MTVLTRSRERVSSPEAEAGVSTVYEGARLLGYGTILHLRRPHDRPPRAARRLPRSRPPRNIFSSARLRAGLSRYCLPARLIEGILAAPVSRVSLLVVVRCE